MFDIIRLSETYLDNSDHGDDNQLALPGFNLIRVGNQNNIKRGGVCIYYRKTLPVEVIIVKIINKCLVCELFLKQPCLSSKYLSKTVSVE